MTKYGDMIKFTYMEMKPENSQNGSKGETPLYINSKLCETGVALCKREHAAALGSSERAAFRSLALQEARLVCMHLRDMAVRRRRLEQERLRREGYPSKAELVETEKTPSPTAVLRYFQDQAEKQTAKQAGVTVSSQTNRPSSQPEQR